MNKYTIRIPKMYFAKPKNTAQNARAWTTKFKKQTKNQTTTTNSIFVSCMWKKISVKNVWGGKSTPNLPLKQVRVYLFVKLVKLAIGNTPCSATCGNVCKRVNDIFLQWRHAAFCTIHSFFRAMTSIFYYLSCNICMCLCVCHMLPPLRHLTWSWHCAWQ